MASRKALFAGGAVLLVVVIAVVLVITLKDDNEDSGQAESNGTVVTTEFGKLRGAWVDGKQGRGFKYAAFRGIPYAQAPVGRLRFKGPRDPEKWDGIRDATQEGSTCYQKDSGSEDCLFLNVYTPALPTEKENPKRAVYVHVHGGGFITGSATAEYRGPDFLVQQDIVVVLMNYRLGFLGFMSLDTDVIPGNVALKDVVHSLQWIQRNIHNFGGDPSKVTLGGCSAGGVGAGWLSILPATQGLFRSAIVLSGTPVSGWGLNLRNIEYAKTIYKLLTGKDSDDRSEIGEMLMTVDVDELYKAVLRATDILHETKSLGSDISFFATPTLEEREDGVEKKLITRDAESYVINPERDTIPIILGETAREWIQIFTTTDLYNKTFLEDVIENSFISRVTNGVFPGKETRRLLNISEDKDVNKYVKEIRDYYFLRNVTENYDNTCKMADFLSHSYIMADTSHFARLRSKYCPEPTYFYVFNVKSEYNMDTSSFPPCMRDAVVHSDDEAYLWTAGFQDKLYYGDSRAARAVRRQVALLTNFVKEMDPTPRLDDDVITLRWRPIRHGEPETYLEINDDLVQRDGSPQGEDSQIWTKVYSELREGK